MSNASITASLLATSRRSGDSVRLARSRRAESDSVDLGTVDVLRPRENSALKLDMGVSGVRPVDPPSGVPAVTAGAVAGVVGVAAPLCSILIGTVEYVHAVCAVTRAL